MIYQLRGPVEFAEEEQDLERAHLLVALTQLRHRVDGRYLQLRILIVFKDFQQDVNCEEISKMLNQRPFGFNQAEYQLKNYPKEHIVVLHAQK